MTNKEMLIISVNYHHYRSGIITYSIIMSVFYVFVMLLTLSVKLTDIAIAWSVAYFFLVTPFIIYNAIKIHSLLKAPDKYREYTATAVDMIPAARLPIAFILNVENGGSSPFTLKTERIFSLSALSSTYYGNFYRQKLRILYDAEGDRLAVIEYLH